MLSSIDFRLNIQLAHCILRWPPCCSSEQTCCSHTWNTPQGTPLKGSDWGVFSKDCPAIGGKSPRSPRLLGLSLTSRLSPALHHLLPEPVATSTFSKCWHLLNGVYVLCLVAQLCPTLCDPMDCSPPVSSVRGDSPAKNTGVGCHALLQGIFPTQGSSPGLLHCGWILYQLSHKGSPRILSEPLNK